MDFGGGTGAGMGGVTEVATRAGIHCSNKDKIGRVGSLLISARDGNFFIF